MDSVVPGCDICLRSTDLAHRLRQTDNWNVDLKSNQAYLGQAVVSLRRHEASISEVSLGAWTDLKNVMDWYEATLTRELGTTMFNWTCLLNDAYKAESPVPHVHWYVWPRYDHPVEIADRTFNDPNFGHHYDKQARLELDPKMRALIIKRIREAS